MEHMTHLVVAFLTVAFPLCFHTFFPEKFIHGLGKFPEEIFRTGGDERRRIMHVNGFQTAEPGIILCSLPK